MQTYEPHLFNYCVRGKINYGAEMATAVLDFNSYHRDVGSYWGLWYSGSVIKNEEKAEQRETGSDVIISQTFKGLSLLSDLSIVEERP